MADLSEKRELMSVMNELSEEEITELAGEMGLPVIRTNDIFDKEKTINYLINGGCPGCGKH